MFGMVNALFSSLAFAFLIYTALMQSEELKHQREEIKLTREVHQQQLETLNNQLLSEQEFRINKNKPIITWKVIKDLIKHENGRSYIMFSVIGKVGINPVSLRNIYVKDNDDEVKNYEFGTWKKTYVNNEEIKIKSKMAQNSKLKRMLFTLRDSINIKYTFFFTFELKNSNSISWTVTDINRIQSMNEFEVYYKIKFDESYTSEGAV